MKPPSRRFIAKSPLPVFLVAAVLFTPVFIATTFAGTQDEKKRTEPGEKKPLQKQDPQKVRPKNLADLKLTREEQTLLRKEGVPKGDQVGYILWVRAGKPKFETNWETFSKHIKRPDFLKSTSIGCFSNGDFESNSFANWSLYTMQSAGLQDLTWWQSTNGQSAWIDGGGWGFTNVPAPDVATTDPYGSQHAILPAAHPSWTNSGYYSNNYGPPISYSNLNWNLGVDPLMGKHPGQVMKYKFPNGGNRVLRLGNPEGNGGGAGAVWWFKVTPETQNFGFRYAVALEHAPWGSSAANHQTYEQGQFSFTLIYPQGSWLGSSQNNPSARIDSFVHNADSTSSWYNPGPGKWVWKGPQCYSVRIPDAYLGKWVYAAFQTTDCPFGQPGPPGEGINGHGGYAYIDSICDHTVGTPNLTMTKETYCDNEPIVVDGSQSDPAVNHTWQIQPSDANGNLTGTVLATETKPGSIGAFDVRVWLRSMKKAMQCGKYYTMTLRAEMACGSGQPVKKTFFVECCGQSQNCCEAKITVGPADLGTTTKAGAYRFSPSLLVTPLQLLYIKVEMDLVSSQVIVTGPNCKGYSGPVFSFFETVGSVDGFTSASITPQPYGRGVVWKSPGSSINNSQFPTMITFPPPQGGNCTEYLQFVVRYRITDRNCKTCEVVKRYFFKRMPATDATGGLEPTPIPIPASQWPGVGDDK